MPKWFGIPFSSGPRFGTPCGRLKPLETPSEGGPGWLAMSPGCDWDGGGLYPDLPWRQAKGLALEHKDEPGAVTVLVGLPVFCGSLKEQIDN